MNRNKNIIFRATKRGIVAGAAALMLAGTPVASAVMPVTTAYAAETEDTNYDTMYIPTGAVITDIESASKYEVVENINILQKNLNSFRSDDRMVSGEYFSYAPIKNGESRVTVWKDTCHSQYGDFYSTMSIRYPFTVEDSYAGERLVRVYPTYEDMMADKTRNNVYGKGIAYDRIRYEAKCFENETIFGLNARKTDAIKNKIEELKKTGATFTGTNYEKAKTAFDWTIKNTDYNKLGDSKTFASTFYWLCEGAGVDSMMYISDDDSRVFNVITLDGQNYLVDTYAAVEASDPSAYFNFIPTASDSLHAVKVSLASKAYDPNAKKDTPSDDSNKNNNSGSDSSDNSGNTSDDSDNSSSDDAGSDDSGSTGGGSSSDDSSDSNTNDSSSSSTYTTGRYQRTAGDASYTAVANVPVTIANADTGIYAYDDAIKEAVQSVLPGYTVQNYINIATPAPSGNIQILTPIECLMQNPGLVTGDVTAVKNYYLVYVNNGIIQLLPNTSNSPYMISAPIFGGGNYAIVMAD